MASWLILFSVCSLLAAVGRAQSGDATTMLKLKEGLTDQSQLKWSDPDVCKWSNVQCSGDRVTGIQIGNHKLQGTLPAELKNLTSLRVFELQGNQLTGPLPSLSGLSSLQSLLLSDNNFTSVPSDFFDGMTSLQSVYLDYNSFSPWTIPDGLKTASTLQTFSAVSANVIGSLPDFLGPDTFTSLTILRLALNDIEGPLPLTLAGSQIQSLWLNGKGSGLNGYVIVLQNMTQLTEVCIHVSSN